MKKNEKQKSERKKRNMLPYLLSGIILLLAAAVFIILPPSLGQMKPYTDASGTILPGSISEKMKLKTDDTTLGLFIMAKDETKPVLLICGGGPGIPQYLMEYQYPTGLADDFVLCYWEYRGTGLSMIPNANPDEMTTDRFIEDTAAVTQYLRERFSQEKIYLLGHSFGTYIALNTAAKYPQYYHAYIAMSQISNSKESECLAFDYMKEQYEKAGNLKMAEQFAKYQIRTSEDDYNSYFTSPLRDTSMHQLGVGTTRDMDNVITGIFFPSLSCKTYTPSERINIWKTKIASHQFKVTRESTHFNAFENIPALEIPIYFFAGKYDYTCAYPLQKEYYEFISAPEKEFFTFEESAHSPIYEEPEKAREILQEIVSRTLR